MALIKCKECGKEISDEATVCPHCGKKKEYKLNTNISGKKAFLIAVAVISIVLITQIPQYVENENGRTQGIVWTSSDGTKVIYSNDFEIIKKETKGKRSKDGTYTVKGKLKQNIDGSYTGIMLTLRLLDKDGKKVRDTSGLVLANYVGNKIWEFEVSGNDADNIVVDYEISSCYGY